MNVAYFHFQRSWQDDDMLSGEAKLSSTNDEAKIKSSYSHFCVFRHLPGFFHFPPEMGKKRPIRDRLLHFRPLVHAARRVQKKKTGLI